MGCYAINTASHQSARTSSNRRGDISCFQESKKISDLRADDNRLRCNCVAIRHSRSRPADGRSSSRRKNWRPCCTACRRYCWLVAHAFSAQGQNARDAWLVGRLLCRPSSAPRSPRGSIRPVNSAALTASPLWAGARTLSWSKPNLRNVLLKFLANSPILAFNPSPTQTIAMLAS
jgi:hypothetical protein